jgi:hypothetical protein
MAVEASFERFAGLLRRDFSLEIKPFWPFPNGSNGVMTTTDPLEQSDQEAVWRHFLHGELLDPEVLRRVDERADGITAEIRRIHCIIDDETFRNCLVTTTKIYGIQSATRP